MGFELRISVPLHGKGGHASVVRELPMDPPDGWIIAVGNNAARQRESRRFRRFAKAVHPAAVISPTATIGAGTVVMAGAVVQANAWIGRHVILNTGCSVD